MTRARGTGHVYQPHYKDRAGKLRTAETWAFQFYDRRAHRYRREHGFPSEKAAERALRQRLAGQDRGELVGPSIERTTFDDLGKLIEDDYAANGHRSMPRLRQSLKHLRDWFGGDRAVNVTEGRILAYRAGRRDDGAKPATINRELAALKRAFNLGERSGMVARLPHVEMLVEDNVRKGFFEPEQFRAVLRRLPAEVRPAAEVAYVTGWRVPSEILTRQWRHVDFAGGFLRIEPGEDKNRAGRMFPLDPQLRPVLEAQRKRTKALERSTGRLVPWVFHREGERMAGFYKAWRSACREAGIPGRLQHDFRRTAVRNLIRSGVAQVVAMALVGHKTPSVFRRYAIVDEGMLRDATAKLAKRARG